MCSCLQVESVLQIIVQIITVSNYELQLVNYFRTITVTALSGGREQGHCVVCSWILFCWGIGICLITFGDDCGIAGHYDFL